MKAQGLVQDEDFGLAEVLEGIVFLLFFHTAGLFPVVRDMYESVFFVNNEVL